MKTRLLVFFGLAGIALAQQPTISPGGIVNVASFAFSGLPSGDIAQGSMFTVFGTNMGPAALQQANSFPLPTTLAGTSLKVTSGTTTVTPIINYTSAGQIAAILPSSTPTGTASMTVTYNGQTSAPVPFKVVASSFGIFTSNQGGTGPGIIADANSRIFGLNSAAHPGDAAVIWGTGLGPVSGNEAGGALPGDMASVPVEVYVGTVKANVTYRGRSGCCAGVDQITFTVPNNVLGCRVSVALKINSVVSNFATMPIAPAGTSACSDPGGPSASQLQQYSQNGLSVGGVVLTRVNTSITVPVLGSITTSADIGGAAFQKYTPQQLNTAQNPFGVSTTGACTVYYTKGSQSTANDPVIPASLDAGSSITVTGAAGSKQLTKATAGGITSYAGSLAVSTGTGPGFLEPGTFTISGPGGANIGAFTTTLVVPQVLNWTNQANVNTVNRSAGQNITWTGGDPNGTVVIAGTSVSGTASDAVGAGFSCLAKGSDGQFNIPAAVLLALPATATNAGVPIGSLIVGTTSAPKIFTASGLDLGVAVSTVDSVKTLSYQ